MTDWDAIVESIERASLASEAFLEAGDDLIINGTPDEVHQLGLRMKALMSELETVQRLLSPGSPVASDEIAEIFSMAMSGRQLAYRRSPRPPKARPKDLSAR
jgi:hypothetical protein